MNKKYFGTMLDMSRNGVMKPEQVKNFARIIRSFGYNMLQLYTEDTYEVDGELYFGYMRGRYTKEEIKDINAYCNSIGVELIPCIQTLAHLNAIFRWEDYRPINDVNDILLVGEERTYQLIENMFKTLRECFSSEYIHIGMDEAHMLGLGKYLDKHGKQESRFEILRKHLDKVLAIAQKYGFKPMMWSDMFFRLDNGGEYYGENLVLSNEVKASVPKDVELVYWDYYHDKKSFYNSMIRSHKELSDKIWFAGGAWCWMGFASGNVYTMDTMVPAMQACREEGVQNVFITLWGDDGKECSYYSLLPSLYALKRIYDSEENMEKIKSEFKALTGEDYDDMFALDIPNFVGGNQSIIRNVSKTMLYNDLFLGMSDSAVKEGITKEFKQHAKRLAKIAKTSQYGYIFDCSAKLCDVLSVKYDLGYKLRKAYQAQDKETLTALVSEIAKAERKLEKFYLSFRNLWYTENKPHGFDVMDFRLGGVKMRLRSCKERLQGYLDGTVESIPELEEELLDVFGLGKEFAKATPFLHSWKFASPNVIYHGAF